MNTPDKLSLIVFSGSFERVHYALVTAAAAAATNLPVTLFFTMGASNALRPDGWKLLPNTEGMTNDIYQSRGVVGFEELLDACIELGVTIMVCEMGLHALGLQSTDLRADIPITPGGLVTFLLDASAAGGMLFI